jgi:hypothetical protein
VIVSSASTPCEQASAGQFRKLSFARKGRFNACWTNYSVEITRCGHASRAHHEIIRVFAAWRGPIPAQPMKQPMKRSLTVRKCSAIVSP